jgi:hypothetical protein
VQLSGGQNGYAETGRPERKTSRQKNMKTISDHILDILQNSVRAGATLIEIIVCENKTSDIYAVEIKDNGQRDDQRRGG